jgi:hypothetical protein
MKLESLKKDKFEPFKENEIQNMLKIVGGKVVETTKNGGSTCDEVNYGTKTRGVTDGAGTSIDYREWSN